MDQQLPCHASKWNRRCWEESGIELMKWPPNWPPNSPELSAIELPWLCPSFVGMSNALSAISNGVIPLKGSNENREGTAPPPIEPRGTREARRLDINLPSR